MPRLLSAVSSIAIAALLSAGCASPRSNDSALASRSKTPSSLVLKNPPLSGPRYTIEPLDESAADDAQFAGSGTSSAQGAQELADRRPSALARLSPAPATRAISVGHNSTDYRLAGRNAEQKNALPSRTQPETDVILHPPQYESQDIAQASDKQPPLSPPFDDRFGDDIPPSLRRPEELLSADGAAQIQSRDSNSTVSTNDLVRWLAQQEALVAQSQPGETEASRLEYIKRHVELRWLYLMTGQQERALLAIPNLDPVDQEFWQQTFWGLTNYFDATSIPAEADRAAQTVQQMQNAVSRLQEKAHLTLQNMTFCHKISSFGNYERYPQDEFNPGQDVLVYVEANNVQSELTNDGKSRTILRSKLEIARADVPNVPVEQIEMPELADLCRVKRRDYFQVYEFTIPATLRSGPHILKLIVEDKIGRRTAAATVNFTVR